MTWGGGRPADGFDDEEGPRGPLLPPDDRIWRHPSEVGATLRGRARRVRRRSRLPKPTRNWRIALLAGTIGGMLAAGTAAATDVFGLRTAASVIRLVHVPPPRASVSNTAGSVAASAGVAVMRASALPSPGPGPALPDTVPAATTGQLVVAVALDPGRGGVVVGVGTVRAADTQMTAEGRAPYLDVMELDAPLPAGTPGGLVLDGKGTPIGLTLAVRGEAGSQRSYAAPLSVVRDSAAQLAATGHVVHAWLGVEGHDLDAKAAAGLGLTGGAEVTAVQPGSPAAGAGLQGDDVIGEVDGQPVYSMLELRASLRLRRPGESVTLTVMRGGQPRRAQATLGGEPAQG